MRLEGRAGDHSVEYIILLALEDNSLRHVGSDRFPVPGTQSDALFFGRFAEEVGTVPHPGDGIDLTDALEQGSLKVLEPIPCQRILL
jgi:hypothetical protein